MSETAPVQPAAPAVAPPPPAPAAAPTTTAAAPAAPTTTPAPGTSPAAPVPLTPEVLARQQAAMVKREIELQRVRKQEKAEREALAKELESAKQQAARWAAVEKLAKENPAEAIKTLGLDYGTITKAQMQANPDAPVKRSEIEELRKQIAAEKEREKEEARKAQETAQQEAERKQAEAEYQQWSKRAEQVADSMKDKYETLMESWQELSGAPSLGVLVLDQIQVDYEQRVKAGEKDARPITIEAALERLNAIAEKKAEKIAAVIEKRRAKQKPADAENKPVSAENTANTKTAAPAVEAKKSDAENKPVDKANVAADDAASQPIPLPGEHPTDFLARYEAWQKKRAAK